MPVPATITAEFTAPGSLSRAASSVPETVWISRSRWAQTGVLRRALIECHGAGLWADAYFSGGVNRPYAVAGFPTLVPDCGGTGTDSTHGTAGWGSDAAIAAVDAAVTLALSQPDCKTDKVFLQGESMGTLAATLYAVRNPTKVAAVVCVLPALNLVDLHDNRLLPDGVTSISSVMEPCYGGFAGYVASVQTNNPMYQAQHGNYPTSVPTLLCYSASDPIAIPGFVSTFQGFVGSSVTTYAIAGASGHDSSLLDPNVSLSFFAAHD